MNDLVKRLRSCDGLGDPDCNCAEAAARIEELEAALLAVFETTDGLPGATIQECRQIARAALKGTKT